MAEFSTRRLTNTSRSYIKPSISNLVISLITFPKYIKIILLLICISHFLKTFPNQVYGYSMGFGKANHQKTGEILKRRYPDYTIDWSDEGY